MLFTLPDSPRLQTHPQPHPSSQLVSSQFGAGSGERNLGSASGAVERILGSEVGGKVTSSIMLVISHFLGVVAEFVKGKEQEYINQILASFGGKANNSGKKQQALTVEQCRNIADYKHDYCWIGDGIHCIVFNCKGARPHTFCAKETSLLGEVCCQMCLVADPANKDMSDRFKAGGFSLEGYRANKEQISLSIARNRLRAANEPATKLKTDPSLNGRYQKEEPTKTKYNFLRDHAYYSKLGLVLEPIIVKGAKKFRTIGIDERHDGRIRPITLQEMDHIVGLMDVIVQVGSVYPDAQRHMMQNIRIVNNY